MKRKTLAALCTTLAIGMATASFAKDHELNGFFRVRGMLSNYGFGTATVFSEEAKTSKIYEQRVRMKYTMNLNEYLGFTYFGEIDFDYGDEAFTDSGRNDGGAIQADSTNLETKNLYMSFKVPETPVSGTVGMQGFADNWSGYFLLSDVAGIKLNAKFEQFDVALGTFKLWEGDNIAEDDVDLWALMVGFKPMGDLKLGLDFFYANDNDSTQPATANPFSYGIQNSFGGADLWWLGVNGAYKVGGLGLEGWAFYNGGTIKAGGTDATDDVDVAGFALDVMGKYTVGGVNLGLEGFYVSGDDDDTDDEINMPLSTDLWSGGGNGAAGGNNVYGSAGPSFPFYKSGLIILLYDPFGCNSSQAALRDAQTGALGLWGVVLSGSYTPPNLKAMYIKGAIGYVNSVEDADTAYGLDGGANLGTEFAARVGYKMAEALDLSLNGAYVMAGDFYDGWAAGEDIDDPYTAYFMANLTF